MELNVLFLPPTLGPEDLAVVARIDEIRRQFAYAVSSRRWTGSLRRMAVARAVRGSNSIEGYRVSLEDALAAIDDEPPLDAESEAWLAVMGYRHAMTYVLGLADDPHFSYSRGLLRSLHYMMLSHVPARNPGKWRPGPIRVVNETTRNVAYEAPPAEEVNQSMHELVESLIPGEGPALIRGAMAHLNLAMIHPFSDGNGRMARCLQTLVLVREQVLDRNFCSIEEYLGYKQQPYYDVLSEVGQGSWHPENDARPWVRFCLVAHYRQALNLVRWNRIYGRLWEMLERAIATSHLPDRTITALSDAALGYKVRNATYRKGAGELSLTLAGRDLRAVAAAGLLESRGEKRGRYYVASSELRQMGQAAYEKFVESDPFELTG